MTKYATNNPLGSMDPKDLFDNAQNLDFALNDITQSIWKDRFGRSRRSYWGMEQAFSAQLLSQQQRFDNFIQSSGYKVIGEYTAGPLTITEYNQLIRYQNEFYKLTAATALPFTTTGNDAASWANDSSHFVGVGDAALRQELFMQGGAGMVGGLSKPVTWSGFADGADPTGTVPSDAAFSAAAASGTTCLVPKGTYLLNVDTPSGSWIVLDGVTFTGPGKLIGNQVKYGTLVNDYGGTPGRRWVSDVNPAKLHRFNDRLFAGGSSKNNGYPNSDPLATHSWVDDPAVMGLKADHATLEQNAMAIAAVSDKGFNGLVTGSRAADAPFGATIGLTSVALQDRVANSQAAWAGYFVGIKTPAAATQNGVNNVECNLWNQKGDGDAGPIDPYNFFPFNNMNNLWLSNGFPEAQVDRPSYRASSAIGILNNVTDTTKAKYRVGIAFKATSLEGCDGITGRGIALALARGHCFQWYYGAGNAGPYFSSNVDSDANGIQNVVFDNFGFLVRDTSSGNTQFRVEAKKNTVNYPRLSPGLTGGDVVLAADGGDADIHLRLMPKGSREILFGGTTRPTTANAFTSGSASFPWSGGFTQTAFTVTSDESHKTKPVEIVDAILDAAEEVDLVQYQYLDRVEAKGEDGARWHFGAIAQRYVEAFERHGLDAHRFAFLCYDEWDDQFEKVQTNVGAVVTKIRQVEKPFPVTKTRTVSKPVMITETRETLVDAELDDGTKIKKVVEEEYQRPELAQIFIFNDDGTPRMDEHGVQLFIYEPLTEEVTEEYQDTEIREVTEEYTESAEPEYEDVLVTPAGSRYGIRYEEMLVLEAAVQRRKTERLIARIEALEGARNG